jgi:hypothetical protein
MSADKTQSLVGTTVHGFRVLEYIPGCGIPGARKQQAFVLLCPAGHKFERNAWDIVKAKFVPRCVKCSAQAQTADYEPEVCNCTYFNGTLRHACNRHRGAA